MSETVYMLAQIDVKDHQQYIEEYGLPVLHQLTEAGAEVLVATAEATVHEGEWSGNWTVIARFESEPEAMRWYQSEAYELWKHLRIEKLTNSNNVVLVPGLDPNQLGAA